MQKLFIFCGYPFSGKTRTARLLKKELGFTVVCLDDVNRELGLGVVGKSVTREQWDKTYPVFYQRIGKALANGETVIVDAVSHKKEKRDALRARAKKQNVQAVLVWFSMTEEEARKGLLQNRKTKKRFDVSDKIFQTIIADFELPTVAEIDLNIRFGQPNKEILNAFRRI